MTTEQRVFYEKAKAIDASLARWIEEQFDEGFSIDEVKTSLKTISELTGRK